jgi:hypothetical protein
METDRTPGAMTRDQIFHSSGYATSLDRKRLTSQLGRIRAHMQKAGWQTVTEIRAALEAKYAPTIFPENSIQAQLRNLRKSPFNCKLEKRRRGSDRAARCAGIWEYHLIPQEPAVE